MPENWKPCRDCPHAPGDHQAVIVQPVCVEKSMRVLFEGTLGACLAEGCACLMWMPEKPTRKELAADGRDVPAGCELVAVPSKEWRIDPGRPCRHIGPGRAACGTPSAASMTRGTTRPSRWSYCEDHMFRRWIEDGKVMNWILRELEHGNA